MSTVSYPAIETYQPSLSSAPLEQVDISTELTKKTSSLETDKLTQIARQLPLLPCSAAKESFLTYCTEVLQFNNEDEDDDQISEAARDVALNITVDAYTMLLNKWRNPRVATDGGGGIRLTWKSREKELRAVFPADFRRTRYLYAEQGEKHYTIPNFTAATLHNEFEQVLAKQMIEQSSGTEPVECEEIAYRALKRVWTIDESIPAEAFIRRIRGSIAEDAVSISRSKYTTARECRLKLNRMRGSASIHVGRVRDLPFGLDVIPAPVCNEAGEIVDPSHCLLTNLPDPVNDPGSAEFAASQVIKIARYVTPDQEEREYKERTSLE